MTWAPCRGLATHCLIGWCFAWPFTSQEGAKARNSAHPVFELSCLCRFFPSGPQKVAAIPPFLSPGQRGRVGPSCSGSSGLLSPSSCSCCSLSDSPASYPCPRKTTAVPSPTTSPDHSTPCSDTPMVLLHSEAGHPPHQCWQHEEEWAQSNPRLSESLILAEGLSWQLRLSSIPCG